jgi:hypothetical protein
MREYEVWTRTVTVSHMLTKRGALVLTKTMAERHWAGYPTLAEAQQAVLRLTERQGGIFYVKGDHDGEERLPGGDGVASVPGDADAGIGETDGADDDVAP